MSAPPAAQPATGRRAGGRPWRSVTQFSARMPLRVKLVAALLTLVIAALAAISIAGAFVLRDYLHSNADKQVSSLFQNFSAQIQSGDGQLGIQGHCFGSYMDAFVPSGQSLDQVDCSYGGPPFPKWPSEAWLRANSGQFATLPARSGDNSWRVLTKQTTIPGPGGVIAGTLIAGEDLGNINQTIGRLISIDLIVGAVVVLGLAIVGVAVVRASLRPLIEIERTAGQIAAGDLTKRVAERDPATEVGRLGRSLNAMLARIEAAFHAQVTSEANARRSENRMRQFVADASHELRTPLTTIRGYAEYYRQRGGAGLDGRAELAPEDLDRIMHRVEDEADRMGVLVEDLLLLARIDQQRPLEHRPVDMLALAADAVQDARMVAPSRQVTLSVGRDTAFLVLGDEARLRQVVGNLVNNALTHTPDGTPVELHVRSGRLGWGPDGPVAITGAGLTPGTVPPPPGADLRTVPAVLLEVTDHGPGLTAEQAHRVFERFYRADQARTRRTGGAGLGLAIVSALVSSHGGAVSVDSRPGLGATFRVALPLAPEAQGGHDDDPADETPHDSPPSDTAPGDTARGNTAPSDTAPSDTARRDTPSAGTTAWPPANATPPGQPAPDAARAPAGDQPEPAQQPTPPPSPWQRAAPPDIAEQRGWKP